MDEPISKKQRTLPAAVNPDSEFGDEEPVVSVPDTPRAPAVEAETPPEGKGEAVLPEPVQVEGGDDTKRTEPAASTTLTVPAPAVVRLYTEEDEKTRPVYCDSLDYQTMRKELWFSNVDIAGVYVQRSDTEPAKVDTETKELVRTNKRKAEQKVYTNAMGVSISCWFNLMHINQMRHWKGMQVNAPLMLVGFVKNTVFGDFEMTAKPGDKYLKSNIAAAKRQFGMSCDPEYYAERGLVDMWPRVAEFMAYIDQLWVHASEELVKEGGSVHQDKIRKDMIAEDQASARKRLAEFMSSAARSKQRELSLAKTPEEKKSVNEFWAEETRGAQKAFDDVMKMEPDYRRVAEKLRKEPIGRSLIKVPKDSPPGSTKGAYITFESAVVKKIAGKRLEYVKKHGPRLVEGSLALTDAALFEASLERNRRDPKAPVVQLHFPTVYDLADKDCPSNKTGIRDWGNFVVDPGAVLGFKVTVGILESGGEVKSSRLSIEVEHIDLYRAGAPRELADAPFVPPLLHPPMRAATKTEPFSATVARIGDAEPTFAVKQEDLRMLEDAFSSGYAFREPNKPTLGGGGGGGASSSSSSSSSAGAHPPPLDRPRAIAPPTSQGEFSAAPYRASMAR
jgi:hypothetical protein